MIRGDESFTEKSCYTHSLTHRVCLYAADKRIRFLGTTGEYFFWVPTGTKEFAIRVAGESSTERVKAALRNPDGKTIEEKDNIAAAHQFPGKSTGSSAGEIWSLRLEKPSTGVLDDFQIRFEGVPPVLAHTKASLLLSRIANTADGKKSANTTP